jgi:hypothetical protein
MKNKIKLSLATSLLILGSLSFPSVLLADTQEPILIQIYDTDIGTTAFEQLIAHGDGGHATIGAILGDAQNMSSNPGIGFSIGSGGNGYRPSIIIAVWTDQPFSVSTGLATIKSHFNVSSNPVTTNGDCAISCDGTVQPEESSSSQIVVESQPEPVQQTDQNVVEQPVLIQQPEQPEQTPAPQVLPDNTPQYTIPTVTLEPFSSYATPGDVIIQSPVSNKIITNKKFINKNKIKITAKPKNTIKKARVYATNKTTR